MLANPAFKPLLPISVAILILGLWFLVHRWPRGVNATFSRHAAAQKLTIWYYIVLFAIALPLLFLFFMFWFVPYYGLSYWFLFFVGASQALQHIVTLIPEVGGWRTKWHGICTSLSALLLLPALICILASSSVHIVSKVIVAACLLTMMGIIAYQVQSNKQKKSGYLLLLQSGYYGAFFVAIAASAYIS